MRQYIDVVQDVQGNALVGVTVLVQNYVGGANASIYSDNGLTPIVTSTVTSGADGSFSFFAADGDYNLVFSKNATVYKTQSPVSIFDSAPQLTYLDTGTANAYAIANSTLEKALRAGLRVNLQVANSNTGASTFQYNGLTAKSIYLPGGTALAAQALLANGIYELEYDGTGWQLKTGSLSPSTIGQILYPQTAAETAASVTPSNYVYPPGNAARYGVDATGTNDATTAMQNWINAAWAMYQYQDGQGLWSGGGGAYPVLTLPPGKYKVSGTIYLPTGCTLQGAGHPANTVSHTRIIMNSTGYTPARVWSATTAIVAGGRINAGNGTWFYTTLGGTTGSSVPTWPGSGTVADGTITWTYGGSNSAGDNRNKPILQFGRGTLPRGQSGGSLQDSAAVVTIQNLEFWCVTIGGSFSNPNSGSGYAVGDYPLGGVLSFDVDTADCRIKDCVFQNNPASLVANGINLTSATRGDGYSGNRGLGVFFEDCEFDGASAHAYILNCYVNFTFKGCQFYNTPSFYGSGCTGELTYQGCYFQYGASIGAPFLDMGYTFGSNNFTYVNVKGNLIESPANYPAVYLLAQTGGSVTTVIDISQNTLPIAATTGGIYVNGATAGSISNNVLNNQGYNASAGSGPTNFIAAINAQYTTNLKICDNVICENSSATYGGFGIFTYGGSGNLASGNTVSTPYNGATYNSMPRSINLASTDFYGTNFDIKKNTTGVTQGATIFTAQTADPVVGITYSTSMTPNAALGKYFSIYVTNSTAFTVNTPSNSYTGQRISILIENASGGAMGAVTWSGYKLSAWTNPANGYNRTIDFINWGGTWYQDGGSTADVPN